MPKKARYLCWCRLAFLAVGAIFAGMVWLNPFFGDHDKLNDFFGMEPHVAAAEHSETTTEATTDHSAATVAEHHGAPKGAIFMHPDSTILDDAHHAPNWVKVSPFIAMLIGFATAWLFYIKRPDLPGRLAASQRPLYLFLLNKWYFDELYDFAIIRPIKWLGTFLWKRGDGNVIDGTLNGIAMGLVPRLTRLAGRMQSGYLFHYAGAMVIGIVILLTMMTLGGGGTVMESLLSIITFIPLVGALILALFLRGDDEAAQRNAKWLALSATSATFFASLFVIGQFDASNTDFQFVEEHDWLLGMKYKMGVDGISVLFVMLTTFLMPITIAACWGVNTRVKEYMIAFLMLETLMLGVFMRWT